MIENNNDLIQLILKTFEEPIIIENKDFNSVILKFKGSMNECSFSFQYKSKDCKFCAEEFKGHNCLIYNFSYKDQIDKQGGGYMNVADEKDQSNEVIDFIQKHLKKARRKTHEQMSIFEALNDDELEMEEEL